MQSAGAGRSAPMHVGALPVGVAYIGADATVLDANVAFASMLGVDLADLLGTNVLAYVAEDGDQAGGMIEFAVDHTAGLMGPVPVRFRDRRGRMHRNNLWAENRLADPEVAAIVVVLAPEEASVLMAEALETVAAGAPVDVTLERLARALRANPMRADGCWLVRSDDREPSTGHLRRLVGSELFAEGLEKALRAEDALWAWSPGDDLIGVERVPESSDLHRFGIRSWWALPVRAGDDPTIEAAVDAALLVLFDAPLPLSPNQNNHLQQLTTIAGLAAAQHRRIEALAHQASHDPLTGLSNRAGLRQTDRRRTGPGVAVLYIDLDRFKPVNDRFGHAAGDAVLVTVAERLRRATRPGDEVTRLGGDEFLVTCRGLTALDDIGAVAERVLAALREPIRIDAGLVEIGASIGVAKADGDADLDALIATADAALYEAKAAGRDRWVLAGS